MKRQRFLLAALGFLGLALLAAPGRAGTPLNSLGEPPPDQAAAPPAVAASSLVGQWTGRYVCGQGETGLSLVLGVDGVHGVFYFYPVPGNPRVPHGCFDVSHGYEPGTRTVLVTPGSWRMRPRGFVSGGIQGTLSADGRSISGRIIGPPGCGRVNMVRSEQPLDMPALCMRALR